MGWVDGFDYSKKVKVESQEDGEPKTFTVLVTNSNESDYGLSYDETIFNLSDGSLTIEYSYLKVANQEIWEKEHPHGHYSFLGDGEGYSLKAIHPDGKTVFFDIVLGELDESSSDGIWDEYYYYEEILNYLQKDNKNIPEIVILATDIKTKYGSLILDEENVDYDSDYYEEAEDEEILDYLESTYDEETGEYDLSEIDEYEQDYYLMRLEERRNKKKNPFNLTPHFVISYIKIEEPVEGYTSDGLGYGYQLKIRTEEGKYVLCKLIVNAVLDPTKVDPFEYDDSDSKRIDGIKEDFNGNINYLYIPEGIEEVDLNEWELSFNISSIYIPSSVKNISLGLFGSDLKKLQTIVVDENNKRYASFGKNVLVDKESMCLILGGEQAEIPDGVKTIGNNAFKSRVGLEKIVLPNSVIEIGDNAFTYCENLKKVVFSSNLVKIGNSSFDHCTNLEEVAFPNSLQIIGNQTFRDCWKMQKVVLPKSMKEIGNSAFDRCFALKTFVMPNTVEKCDQILVGYGREYFDFFGPSQDVWEYEDCFNTVDDCKYVGDENNPCVALIYNHSAESEIVAKEGTKFIMDCHGGMEEKRTFCISKVVIPHSVTYLGDSILLGPLGKKLPQSKQVIIEYDGSKEDWDKIEKTKRFADDSRITVIFNDSQPEKR